MLRRNLHRNPSSLRTRMKYAHIGLGYAQLMRTQCCGEVLAQTYFVDIGVTVGHRNQGVTGLQKIERRQHISKQIYFLPLLKEKIKGRFRQIRRLPRSPEQDANGLPAKGRHVGSQIRAQERHLLSHLPLQSRGSAQSCRAWRVLGQPSQQGFFSTRDGGPYWP